MRQIKNILYILLIIFGLILASSFWLAYKYQNELNQLVINQLNNTINAKIDVKKINLTLFPKFPNVSVHFSDVLVSSPQLDSICSLQNVFFEFDVIQVIKGNYEIQTIDLENGILNFTIDKNGQANYDILKKKEKNSKNGFFIDLRKIKLNNVQLNYIDKKRNNELLLFVNKLYAKGMFSEQEFNMDLFGDIKTQKINLDNQSYFNQKKWNLDLGFKVSNLSNFELHRGFLTLNNKANFDVTGFLKFHKKTTVNLKITGNKLTINEIITFLSPKKAQQINELNGSGVVTFEVVIIGTIDSYIMPSITANFNINEGEISYRKSNFKAVEIKGVFTNKWATKLKKAKLTLSTIKAKTNTGIIDSKLSFIKGKMPEISLQLNATMDFKELITLLQLDTLITPKKGNVEVQLSYKGKVNTASFSIKKIQLKGVLKAQDIAFTVEKTPYKVTDLNTNITIKNNKLTVSKSSVNYKSHQFNFNGTILNVLNYAFLENEKLLVIATLKTNSLDVNKFIKSEGKQANKNSISFEFMKQNTLRLKTEIEHLKYKKFTANHVSGQVIISSFGVLIKNASMNAFDGKVDFTGKIIPKTVNQFSIISQTKLNQINVSKLLYELDNFGQTEITNQNIKGIGSIDISYKSFINSQLKIDIKSIITNANIKVVNGELNNYKPLQAIPKSISRKKLIAVFVKSKPLAERLKHIKFDVLKNNISINNEVIHIPTMQINSSALDLELTGNHTFENKIEYQMKMYLSDFFTKKRNEKGNKKTPLNIRITGTTNNPNVDVNLKSIKLSVTEKVKKEQQTVKEILKEEFNLFKNDTTLKKQDKTQKLNYDIEWEDKPVKNVTKKEKKITKKKKEKLKNTNDFNFEDDDF